MNCLGLCFALYSFAFVSMLFFIWTETLSSIPSRFQHTRPIGIINEGGKMCFSDNSTWKRLRSSKVESVVDAIALGGTDPKNILFQQYNDTSFKTLWKPLLPKVKKHRANAQNEILVFHLDCILDLRRTPAATILPLDTYLLAKSLSSYSKGIYQERIKPPRDWETWFEVGTITGVNQEFLHNIIHITWFSENVRILFEKVLYPRIGINIWDWILWFSGGNSTTIREYSQKDMLDFICANWDRSHNQFVYYDKQRGSYELAYVDHNHLKSSDLDAFQLKYCKFWKDSVDLLKSLTSGSGKNPLETIVSNSLKQHEPLFDFSFDNQDVPLSNLDARAKKFLQHVDECVAKYGANYVFID